MRRGASPSSAYLRVLLWVLRLLGLRPATVSQALASPFGRYACLTFDGLGTALGPSEALIAQRVPATVFVHTKGGPTLKNLPPLVRAGWEVGSLGHELVDLTTKGYGEQRRMVSRSRSLLTAKTGQAPKIFAYPYGAYDATTVSCVRDEGFQAAVTLRRGANNGDLEAFHLRRVPLTGALGTDLFLVLRAALTRPEVPASTALPAPARDAARSGVAL
jgi:peptidoglycan/xylan/chitin deacetylase (PgdA/CDA1 family)